MDAAVGWTCERGAVGRYGGMGRLAAAREVTVGVTSVGDAGVHRGLSPTAATRDDVGHLAAPESRLGVPRPPGPLDDFLSKVTPRQVHGRPERLEDPPAGRPQGRAAHARADTVGENLAALGFVSLSLRCHLFLFPTWLLVSWTFSPLRTSRADSLRTLSLSLSSPRFSVCLHCFCPSDRPLGQGPDVTLAP